MPAERRNFTAKTAVPSVIADYVGGALLRLQNGFRTLETESMVTPVSAILFNDECLARLNLSGVYLEQLPRATMRVAPSGPKKSRGLEGQSFLQGVRQAGVPFTSSVVQ